MIGKVTRGSNVGGLLRYLYGPGRANEHTDPHLVASWLGDDTATLNGLEPVAIKHRFADLTDRLSMPLGVLPAVPEKFVWQCSMRLADGDRRLTDVEWAAVAREVVEQTGFAPAARWRCWTGLGPRWLAGHGAPLSIDRAQSSLPESPLGLVWLGVSVPLYLASSVRQRISADGVR